MEATERRSYEHNLFRVEEEVNKFCTTCSFRFHSDDGSDLCDKCWSKKFITSIWAFIIALLAVAVITGCAGNLLKQSPPLAPENRFYKFEKEPGVISHNRCNKRKGKDRDCTKTYEDVMDMWDLFYPGHIIIKKDKVFR